MARIVANPGARGSSHGPPLIPDSRRLVTPHWCWRGPLREACPESGHRAVFHMSASVRIASICFSLVAVVDVQPVFAEAGWEHYGGDAGGMRYSEAAQITPANVNDLVPVWTWRTGDLARRSAD